MYVVVAVVDRDMVVDVQVGSAQHAARFAIFTFVRHRDSRETYGTHKIAEIRGNPHNIFMISTV